MAGSDNNNNNNNLIGIVKSKDVYNTIKNAMKENGTYSVSNEMLKNGASDKSMVMIDANVLSKSVEILKIAQVKGADREFGASMNKGENGFSKDAPIVEGPTSEIAAGKFAQISLTLADVMIHSHATGTAPDGSFTISMASDEPTDADKNTMANPRVEMYITVGMEGRAEKGNDINGNYSFSDFSAGKYTELKNLRPELQERYKWNKAYFEKRDKILAYDALLINASNLNNNYMNKLNATVNETLYLKATLLALGGIATLMGGYAVIANDNTFTQSERNSLLKYGGASLGIGLIWSILQGSSVKKAGRNASAVQKRADEMKTSIGPVLNKRKESLNESPLININ